MREYEYIDVSDLQCLRISSQILGQVTTRDSMDKERIIHIQQIISLLIDKYETHVDKHMKGA